MQSVLFPPSSTWRPTPVKDLPSWKAAKRIAIDCETRDPDLKKLGPGSGRRKDSYIVGVGFAIEDGPSFYLPYRHEGGDNLHEDQVLKYLRDQAANFEGVIVGANLSYDLDFLSSDRVTFPNATWFRDVQIADPLISELHTSYTLEAIAKRFGYSGKDESMLREAASMYGLDPKSGMWRLPARYVGGYGEQDVRLPLKILRTQEREIDAQDLWKIYDLESNLLPVLVKIRRRGVRVDFDRLARIEAWSLGEENKALAQIKNDSGITLSSDNVWNATALAEVLTAIGVKVKKTAKGQPNVDHVLLEGLTHPVGKAITHARKMNKLRTTFAESVRRHSVNGRIHCTFNQLKRSSDEGKLEGAGPGRMSCSHPNLQQQPSRDAFAATWRAIYLPEEGHLWAACDYSQQEPRMAIHYACLSRTLIGDVAHKAALVARDKYRSDPKTDNHQMMADMAGIKRKVAKAIYLGLSYGMGGAKLCHSLGLPTIWIEQDGKKVERAGDEGKHLLDTFDAKVPFIKRLSKACEAKAKSNGYITTLLGRRCRFPTTKKGEYDWVYTAFNKLIQGSSADQCKAAMIALDKAGVTMLIQVHDEVGLSVNNKEEADRAAEIMRDCVPLELPSRVDVEIGQSWGQSMDPNV